MPIYMKVEGIRGNVTPQSFYGANGGVWKTTNFLTQEARSSGHVARPTIKVFIAPSDPSVVEISRISLTPAGGGVDGRDPGARSKIEQMMNSLRNQGPAGKLYIATDAGVFASADQRGKLLVGSDQGVWRAGEASRLRHTNNLKQIGLAALNTSVDIFVTDDSGNKLSSYRLERASVSRHSNGIQVVLCDGSVKF